MISTAPIAPRVAEAVANASAQEVTHLVSEHGVGRVTTLVGELVARHGEGRVAVVNGARLTWSPSSEEVQRIAAADAIVIDALGDAEREAAEAIIQMLTSRTVTSAPSLEEPATVTRSLRSDALVFVSDSEPFISDLDRLELVRTILL